MVESHEALYKTTTDDEITLTSKPLKTHTFDQILKQEERSAYSVKPLTLPQPPINPTVPLRPNPPSATSVTGANGLNNSNS